MKRILVTGGAGFIGSHLCRRLLSEGNHVTILDNFCTGERQTIADLAESEHCDVVEHDVTKPMNVQVEQIYNLACPASPIQYQRQPIQTMLANVLGSLHLLDLAKITGARILQASTSEVYGNPAVHPQPETYLGDVNTIGPRACYDEGKRCAETMFFDYHRQHDIEIKIARIFNTYGPDMHRDDGRVISNFIHQALEGQPITLYGDGQQTRSFCYIDDMVEGLIKLMESPTALTGPINIGNPDEFTIEELAETILELTGSDSPLVYKPLPQDDPRQRQPDITLAKTMLNWKPKIQLRRGLEKTIEHVRRQLIRQSQDTAKHSSS